MSRITAFRRKGALFAVVTERADGTRGAKLTPAEKAVLALVQRGLDRDAIAAHRGTTRRTVSNQLASLMQKLGAHTVAELGRVEDDDAEGR